MQYYHNLITEKSWQELQSLKGLVDFVLIGGWAVYLYSRALKSKDIDIIVDFDQLPILGKNYNLQKNERLNKYEARKGEIEIDIYLPHFSKIGIPVERLLKATKQVDGFVVVDPNYLLALKIYTLNQRGRSAKGRKDFLDIISLISSKQIDLLQTKKVLQEFKMEQELKVFTEFLKESSQVEELGLNAHNFSRLKKEIVAGLK